MAKRNLKLCVTCDELKSRRDFWPADSRVCRECRAISHLQGVTMTQTTQTAPQTAAPKTEVKTDWKPTNWPDLLAKAAVYRSALKGELTSAARANALNFLAWLEAAEDQKTTDPRASYCLQRCADFGDMSATRAVWSVVGLYWSYDAAKADEEANRESDARCLERYAYKLPKYRLIEIAPVVADMPYSLNVGRPASDLVERSKAAAAMVRFGLPLATFVGVDGDEDRDSFAFYYYSGGVFYRVDRRYVVAALDLPNTATGFVPTAGALRSARPLLEDA